MNNILPPDEAATPLAAVVCDQPVNTSEGPAHGPQNVNKSPVEPDVDSRPRQAVGVPPGEQQTAETPPEEPQPRWCDAMRLEALDYHCMIHGIPRVDLDQASGLPDPKSMSPKQWMERGYPYMIYIDRSQECKRPPVRDTRKVIQVW